VLNDLQLNFLVKKSFELCGDFFIEIQVGDFEQIEQFCFDAFAHILDGAVLIEPRIGYEEMFRADEVPAKNEHEGDDMGEEASVFDDFLGVREDGFFGLDKEEPGK
jgi:hypothetical protein